MSDHADQEANTKRNQHGADRVPLDLAFDRGKAYLGRIGRRRAESAMMRWTINATTARPAATTA